MSTAAGSFARLVASIPGDVTPLADDIKLVVEAIERPRVAGERFQLVMRDDALEWSCGTPAATAEEARGQVVVMASLQPAGWATGYRIERVVVVDAGEWQSLVCTGEAEQASDSIEAAPEPEVSPW